MVSPHSNRKRPSAPNSRRRRPITRGKRRNAADFEDILGRLSDARHLLECGVRLLETQPESSVSHGDERICLRHDLDLLRGVYNDLDIAIQKPRSGQVDHG